MRPSAGNDGPVGNRLGVNACYALLEPMCGTSLRWVPRSGTPSRGACSPEIARQWQTREIAGLLAIHSSCRFSATPCDVQGSQCVGGEMRSAQRLGAKSKKSWPGRAVGLAARCATATSFAQREGVYGWTHSARKFGRGRRRGSSQRGGGTARRTGRFGVRPGRFGSQGRAWPALGLRGFVVLEMAGTRNGVSRLVFGSRGRRERVRGGAGQERASIGAYCPPVGPV
jgi:hypothetical protein